QPGLERDGFFEPGVDDVQSGVSDGPTRIWLAWGAQEPVATNRVVDQHQRMISGPGPNLHGLGSGAGPGPGARPGGRPTRLRPPFWPPRRCGRRGMAGPR